MMRRVGGFLILLVCAGLFQSKLRSYLLAKETRSWPVVQGTLDSIHVEATDSLRYSVELSYHYGIDGQEHVGTTLHPTKSSYRKSEIDQLEPLLASGQIKVHVEPGNPENSTILTGTGSTEVEGLFAGLGALAAGLFFGIGIVISGGRHPTLAILDQMKRSILPAMAQS